ncbi:MAG: NADH:flavin oxidoreductase [Acidimicrobiia bacterium]|nr:NADH:flavin oxidoreductase [Acidimicrobiia bacterium]
MKQLFEPVTPARGPALKNRLVLAPMTDTQSHDDGTLTDEEYEWLTGRARAGFGLTMTCAAHVQPQGRGFPGQLGIFCDRHLDGLARLAAGIREAGSVGLVQLHHAGVRSPAELIDTVPVGPSADVETGARALSLGEVEQLAEDFITAAARAQRAGFDGVEIHGAHGYIISQFLSAEANRREDRYGGSPENRARLLFDIVGGIRERCGEGLLLAVRISPERFGLRLAEQREVARRLLQEGQIDLLDVSLWDTFKEPREEEFQGRPLAAHFSDLERGRTLLAFAGRIRGGGDAIRCLEAGADLVLVGRAAILHHDFPQQVQTDPDFQAVDLPVTADHLRAEGLSETFIRYMGRWRGFVTAEDE